MRDFLPKLELRRFLLPGLVLLVGLALTLGLVSEQVRRNDAFIETQFRGQAERIVGDLSQRVHLYEYGLKGMRGMIASVEEQQLSRRHFQRYNQVRNIDTEFPGARGFGFIRRVAPSDAPSFLNAARQDGWPTFNIRELEANAGEKFVIQYIEPVDRNVQAVGLDIASEENRRTAALEAVRLDQATITEPITLVQATGAANRAFLILLPVYRTGAAPASPEQRHAATWGWSYAALVLDEVLADLLSAAPGLIWSVADLGADGKLFPILAHDATTRLEGLEHSLSLPVFNRQWRIQAHATPQFVEQYRLVSPLVVALSGAMVTLLAVAVSFLWSGSRRRERESLAAKSQLATIVEHSDQAVVGEDTEGKVILWNRAAESLFQISAGDVLGRELPAVLDQNALELAPVRPTVDRETGVLNELTFVREGQSSRVLLMSKSPIYDSDNRLLGSATLLADITERRAMEDALANSNQVLERKVEERTRALAKAEAFLQTVLDSVPSMIAYWDHNGECRAANAAFLRWRRMPREALLGQVLTDVLPQSCAQQLADDLRSAWQGETRATHFKELDVRGQPWRSFSCALIPDRQDSEVHGLYFVADDVTELQRSQSELESALLEQRTQRQRLEGIIEGTHAGTWEWNVRTGEVRFNERWAEILGFRLTELGPGSIQTWTERVHPDDLPRSSQVLEDHFQGRLERYECETRMQHRDGHWVWVQTHGRVTTWTSDGKPEWMFGTQQDVTQRHEMEDELRDAILKATAASDAKTRFLASMSHEIRTPLNAVLGMHRILRNTGLDEHQADLLTKADRAGQSLLELLNDVLDLGKIEAGEMALQLEVFNLRDLFEELTTTYAPSALAKGITFSTHLSGPVDCWIEADRVRVRQILVNLVGNAIKFTEAGGVVLLGQPDGDRLRFTVRDSGIGIAATALPHLFQPFVQAEDNTTRRFGGSGLGLSIVRRLVELMGGTVTVSSTLGSGSSFCVDVPLKVAAETVVKLAQRELRPVTVGYLCSDPMLCGELARGLESLGWTGVNLRSTITPPRLDVLVLDAALGASAEEHVRHAGSDEQEFASGNVLLLGNQRELDAREGLWPGTTHRLLRPFNSSALFNAVVELLSAAEESQDRLMRQGVALARGARWLNGVRILVVDDSEINREIAIELLRSQGAICEEFAGGQDLLKRLGQGVEGVDAILMDVQMPVMDGLQTTRLLRQLPGASEMPVIALSAGVLQSERDQALAAGMDAFLSKPLEPVNLVKVLRRTIRARWGKTVEVTLPANPHPEAVPAGDTDWPVIKGIDLDLAKSQLNHNPALYSKLLRVMRSTYANWSRDWVWQERDWDASAVQALCASLHKMRGSAGMLGADVLVGASRRAEDQYRSAAFLKDRRPLEEVSRALQQLLESIDEWRRAQLQQEQASRLAAPDLSKDQIEQVKRLLHQLSDNDLGAMSLVSELRPSLIQLLGATGFSELESSLDELRFDQAEEVLSRAIEEHEP